MLASRRRERADERLRRCIASGGASPPAGLIRFVLDPSSVVTPDLAERLPGRGAWVSADKDALTRAIEKGLFARAFKARAEAPTGLVETVAALLEKRALDALGLARREGFAVAGFDQVKDALSTGRAAALLTASDAAEDGADKLARAAGAAPRFRVFTTAALSAALGKEGVRHAAVLKGAAAERFLREARRLSGFRSGGMEVEAASMAGN